MRIIQTDRGYIDFDHVLAIGEPYKGPNGLFGFDITLALRDKALPCLYYPEDLGTSYLQPVGRDILTYEETEAPIMEAIRTKRDEYVALWKGEPVKPPSVEPAEERCTCYSRQFEDWCPQHGRCPAYKDGRHKFSSHGMPAGSQACAGCNKVE